MSEEQSHWQSIYEKKAPEEQTWYQPTPDISLELIEMARERRAKDGAAKLIDVGAGASTLVDHLLERGGYEITVVDLAASALEASKQRLGEQVDDVTWEVADLRTPLPFQESFDIWHDRAVFHFLIEERERTQYQKNLESLIAPGGHLVMSTFGPDGPEKCSGLPVRRYSIERLSRELGDHWKLVEQRIEDHPTPWGGEQQFVYGLFERC